MTEKCVVRKSPYAAVVSAGDFHGRLCLRNRERHSCQRSANSEPQATRQPSSSCFGFKVKGIWEVGFS